MVPDGWLTLATVLKPRGNKGEVLVNLLTTDIERLREVGHVTTFNAASPGGRQLEVEDVWMHQDKAIAKFTGIDSINDAETLRGLDLCIPLSERRKPKAGEVFLSDLIGCRIFDKQDVLLGTVLDVYEQGPQVWLQLDTNNALVPWVPDFFPELDIPNKKLVADLPEGLLEVNQS